MSRATNFIHRVVCIALTFRNGLNENNDESSYSILSLVNILLSTMNFLKMFIEILNNLKVIFIYFLQQMVNILIYLKHSWNKSTVNPFYSLIKQLIKF